MCSLGFQRLSGLSEYLHFSVRGYFPVPHVNVTARSSAQFNVLLFKESKCQSFPSADQTMNNCYFRENKSLVLKWQRLNRFWFKVKHIMQFPPSIAGLYCPAINMFWFYCVAENRHGVKEILYCKTSGSVCLLFSTNLSAIKLDK